MYIFMHTYTYTCLPAAKMKGMKQPTVPPPSAA